jgi:tRNA dimethylallyltransferase
MATKPLVVIVGPTASGKTSLAVALAKQLHGEVICADSRTVYKGIDIATAKPTMDDRATVPHWGLDLVEPDQNFSVADFKSYADAKISEIRSRGHIPFIVGGTGLYVDAVLLDYRFGQSPDINERSKLQHMTISELHQYIQSHGITMPENSKNKRYLIRAIENDGVLSSRSPIPQKNSIVVGISTDKEVLKNRIAQRIERMFDDGLIGEAESLSGIYGWGSEAMKSNAFPVIRQYLNNDLSLEEAKAKLLTLDWRLAKRQLTWLRRNKFIQWMNPEEAHKYLNTQLANYI